MSAPTRLANEPLLVYRRRVIVSEAEQAGLLQGHRARVGARIPEKLLESAKLNSGLSSTTEVLEYALAKIAIEDAWVDTFVSLRGSVPPDIDLEY
jgi:hypothetical protein